MNETLNLLVGISVLILGYFFGNFMRRKTMDEQVDGQKYFKIITIASLIVGFVGLVLKKDWLMFTFFFIAIVTSRSLFFKR